MKSDFIITQQLGFRTRYKLALRSLFQVQPVRYGLIIVCGMSVLSFTLRSLTEELTLKQVAKDAASILIVFIVYAVIALITILIAWFTNKNFFEPVNYHFTNAGIGMSQSGKENTKYWREILSVKETRQFFEFYFNKIDYIPISKNNFANDEELESFRHFVHSNMSRK